MKNKLIGAAKSLYEMITDLLNPPAVKAKPTGGPVIAKPPAPPEMATGPLPDGAMSPTSKAEDYPKSVSELLMEVKYKKSTLDAMEHFVASKPYKGTKKERAEKIYALYQELSKVYGIHCPPLYVVANGNPHFCRGMHEGKFYYYILLNDRMSVVTALHEFGHALGKNEKETCTWSINLFRKFFPKEYEKLTPVGHILWKKTTVEAIGLENIQKMMGIVK